MKVLFASDIHGSFYYANLLVEKFKNGNFDKLLLLGDILYHGPRNDLPKDYNPKKVIPILNEIKDKIICVQGNCDAEVDQMVLEFPILREACVEIDGINYYLTHGHVHNPNSPINVNDGVVLYGHSHVINIENVGPVYYINPGSTSIPKEKLIHSYGVIENRKVSIKNLLTDEVVLSVQL
jgi:putative phosphoesterase